MSGIGGILSFNGSSVDETRLMHLGKALDGRASDGGRAVTDGIVGMAYRALHTNRESRLETQPLVSPHRQMLAWDGRLDNRDDLLAYFPDGLNGDKTDVALVMSAYLKWKQAFLPRLIGDFALSLYDPQFGLILARDPFGVRLLYYAQEDDRLVWSSTFNALLAASDVGIEVDDDYIAGFLAIGPEASRTPYRNIHPVEPGHSVVFRNDRLHVNRFWKPDTAAEIRYKTEAEYEEQFRLLFSNAVRSRLRSDRPVWSELSGGLDSSSIVCVADEIIKSGAAGTDRLETVSYIDDESETSHDHKFLRVIEEKRGRKGFHLRCNDGQWLRFANPEERFITKPNTSLCVAGTHERLWKALADDGARVLLSGLGGDQLLWSVPDATPEITDLIFLRRPGPLHQQLQAWSLTLKKPYLHVLWQDGILPLLSTSIRARFQSHIKVPACLDQEFVKRTHLRERLLPPEDPFGHRLPSKRLQASMLFFIVSKIARGEFSENEGVDRSYPFLDRPLVEFMLQIPLEQKLRVNETRSLMRRALKGVVPEKVLQRKSKGIVGETFCRGLAQQWENLKPLLVEARIFQRGYVDRDTFMSGLALARHGKEPGIGSILKLISVEIWLRSIEHWHARTRSIISGTRVESPPPLVLDYALTTPR